MWNNGSLFLVVCLLVVNQVLAKDFNTGTLRVIEAPSADEELKIITVSRPGQEEVSFFTGAASSRKLDPLPDTPVTVVRIQNPHQAVFQDGIWLAAGNDDSQLRVDAPVEADAGLDSAAKVVRRGRQFFAGDDEVAAQQPELFNAPAEVSAFPSHQAEAQDQAAWIPILNIPSGLPEALLRPDDTLPVVPAEVLKGESTGEHVAAVPTTQVERQRSLDLSSGPQVLQFGLEDALAYNEKEEPVAGELAESVPEPIPTIQSSESLLSSNSGTNSGKDDTLLVDIVQRQPVSLQEKIDGRAYTPEEDNINLIPAESAVSSRTVIKKGENGQDYEYEYLYYYEDDVSDLKESDQFQDNKLFAGSDVTFLQSEQMIPVPTNQTTTAAEQELSSSTDDILLLDLSSTEDFEAVITSMSTPTTTTTTEPTTTTTTTQPTTTRATEAARGRSTRLPNRNRFSVSSTTTTEATERQVMGSDTTTGSTRSSFRGKVRFTGSDRNTPKPTSAPRENALPSARTLAQPGSRVSGRRTTTTTSTTTAAPASRATRPSRNFRISSRTGLGASQEAAAQEADSVDQEEGFLAQGQVDAPKEAGRILTGNQWTLPELLSGGALPLPIEDDRLPHRTRFPPRSFTTETPEEEQEGHDNEDGGNASEDEENSDQPWTSRGKSALRVVDSSSFRGTSAEEAEEAAKPPTPVRTRGRLTFVSGPTPPPETETEPTVETAPKRERTRRPQHIDAPQDAANLYALSRALSMDSMEDSPPATEMQHEVVALSSAPHVPEEVSAGTTELPRTTDELSREQHSLPDSVVEALGVPRSELMITDLGAPTASPDLSTVDVRVQTTTSELLASHPTTEILIESTTLAQTSELPTEAVQVLDTTTTSAPVTRPTTTASSRRTTTTTTTAAPSTTEQTSSTVRGRGRFTGNSNPNGRFRTTTTIEPTSNNVLETTTTKRSNFRRGSTAQAEQVTKNPAEASSGSTSATESTSTTRRARPTFTANRFNFKRGPQNETGLGESETSTQQPTVATTRLLSRPTPTPRATTASGGLVRPRPNILHRGRATTTTTEASEISQDEENQEDGTGTVAPAVKSNDSEVEGNKADQDTATMESTAPPSTTTGSIIGRLRNRPALTISEKPKMTKPTVSVTDRRKVLRPRLNTVEEVKNNEATPEEVADIPAEQTAPRKVKEEKNDDSNSGDTEAPTTKPNSLLQNRLRARKPGQLLARRPAETQPEEA